MIFCLPFFLPAVPVFFRAFPDGPVPDGPTHPAPLRSTHPPAHSCLPPFPLPLSCPQTKSKEEPGALYDKWSKRTKLRVGGPEALNTDQAKQLGQRSAHSAHFRLESRHFTPKMCLHFVCSCLAFAACFAAAAAKACVLAQGPPHPAPPHPHLTSSPHIVQVQARRARLGQPPGARHARRDAPCGRTRRAQERRPNPQGAQGGGKEVGVQPAGELVGCGRV